MKPLYVLIIVFIISLILIKLISHVFNYQLAGCVAMSIMLIFTAIGHFKFTKGMSMMIPDFMPLKEAWVYFTGVIEIAAAIGLLIPSLRTTTSWLLILFFVLILPANIYSAVKKVDYEKATHQGKGINYLWFRVPLQLLFISWVCYFGIYLNQNP